MLIQLRLKYCHSANAISSRSHRTKSDAVTVIEDPLQAKDIHKLSILDGNYWTKEWTLNFCRKMSFLE